MGQLLTQHVCENTEQCQKVPGGTEKRHNETLEKESRVNPQPTFG